MKTFTRRQYIILAKAIRNIETVSQNSKDTLIREMVKLFQEEACAFDERMFRDIANCKREDDHPNYIRRNKDAKV